MLHRNNGSYFKLQNVNFNIFFTFFNNKIFDSRAHKITCYQGFTLTELDYLSNDYECSEKWINA